MPRLGGAHPEPLATLTYFLALFPPGAYKPPPPISDNGPISYYFVCLLLEIVLLPMGPNRMKQAEAVGRGVSGVGFVEGDPEKTVGARVLLALARVLEGLLLDLRRPGSAVRPYADIVLRCLVTLFLGEEGFLAVRVRALVLCRCWPPWQPPTHAGALSFRVSPTNTIWVFFCFPSKTSFAFIKRTSPRLHLGVAAKVHVSSAML